MDSDDIFQNNKKNKSKTMFLLFIIGIILIIVLIIVAWILTRSGNNVKILSDEANQTKASETIPLFQKDAQEVAQISNNNLVKNEIQKVDLDSKSSIENKNDNTKEQDVFNLEDDPKFKSLISNRVNVDDIANLIKENKAESKDIVTDKKEIKKPETSKLNDEKKEESKKIVSAIEKEQKQISKNQSKETPKEKLKETKKEEKKYDSNPKEEKQSAKTEPKLKNNIESVQQKVQPKNLKNGTSPSPGHYLQVGAFSGYVSKSFIEKISKYSYRIEETKDNDKVIKKYLIGPYNSKTDAIRDVQKINLEIGKAFYRSIDK